MAEAAFQPRFRFTPLIVQDCMRLQGAKEVVDHLRLPPDMTFRLRWEARARSTHHSTGIEGNPLALRSVPAAVVTSDRHGSAAAQEVRNYWRALEWIEEQSDRPPAIDDDFIRRLHRTIIVLGSGRRGGRSDYRDGQVAVREAGGGLAYLPPIAADVPKLMGELLLWRNSARATELPVPVRAAIMAHRLLSIHPFPDGNGRTARALATAELWFGGYLLRGFLSVEEHYRANLGAYYDAIQMGLPHNYYDGRHDCDLTPWIEYFLSTLTAAADAVKQLASSFSEPFLPDTPWQQLSRRQQQVLTRLVGLDPASHDAGRLVRPQDLVDWFGVSKNTALAWLNDWRQCGFVMPASGRQRVTAYTLAPDLQDFVIRARNTTRIPE